MRAPTLRAYPISSTEVQRRIEVEVEKIVKFLMVDWTFFFYVGSASVIAKEAVRIASKHLNLPLKTKDVAKQIKNYAVRVFRLCPISCIQHPVIFLLTPYPSELLPFLNYTLSHEVLHIKHAFFSEPKISYFAPKASLPYWRKAGYSAFSYEEYFQDLINRIGLKNTHRIVWDYSERIRDFLVNKELLSIPEYTQLTRRWEIHQANLDVAILRDHLISYPTYRTRIALLDLGMRTALLSKNMEGEITKKVIFTRSLEETYLLRIRKIKELFNNLRIPLEPFEIKKMIYSLDQLVSLTRYLL